MQAEPESPGQQGARGLDEAPSRGRGRGRGGRGGGQGREEAQSREETHGQEERPGRQEAHTAGGKTWDSVASCYMLNGEDIRNVPWDGDAQSEIDAFVSEEL